MTPAFELVPYRRREAPGGRGTSVQTACDDVLELYRMSPSTSIQRATVLKVAEREVTDHLEEQMIRRVLVWGELVAFSGLATARFFDQMGYANRDAFRLVVQNFDDLTKGVMVFRGAVTARAVCSSLGLLRRFSCHCTRRWGAASRSTKHS